MSVKKYMEQTVYSDLTPKDLRKAIRLTGNIGLHLNEYGAFLTFGANDDQPERGAYYMLHDLGADQVGEVADALQALAEQMSMMEIIERDDDRTTVSGPRTVQ